MVVQRKLFLLLGNIRGPYSAKNSFMNDKSYLHTKSRICYCITLLKMDIKYCFSLITRFIHTNLSLQVN